MKNLRVNLEKDSYDILIEKNILNKVPNYIKELGSWKNIAIITDSNVDSLYGDRFLNSLQSFGFKVIKSVFPAGEASKNNEGVIDSIYQLVEKHAIDRHSYILVLGGGAVVDAIGFAAATAHRGIRLIRMPSTVLGQNDAGVGVNKNDDISLSEAQLQQL